MTMRVGLLAVGGRRADPFPRGRGPLCGLVAAAVDPAAGRAEDAGVGRRGSGRAGGGARTSALTVDCQGFRGVLGTKVYICKPADPEAKGMLERFHDYLESSFLPGRVFAGPGDFNTQLAGFLDKANARRDAGAGLPPGRPGRRRPGGDAAAATGAAGGRLAQDHAAAARPLRAPGFQRLLGAPGGRRAPDRDPRRPGPGVGDLRGRDRRRPRPGLGPAPDDHRLRAHRRRQAAAPRPGRPAPPGRRRGDRRGRRDPLTRRLRPSTRPRTKRSADGHADQGLEDEPRHQQRSWSS